MSEPDSHENNPNDSASQVEDQLGVIQELEQKLKLLRWGLFMGVLAVMALGISSIWKTTKKAAEPAVEVYNEAKGTYEGVQGKIEEAQGVYTDIAPDVEKAYGIISELIDPGETGKASQLREDFKLEYEARIKPTAEDFANHVWVNLQQQATDKFSEIASESDAIMVSASNELHTLTNSIPDQITEALNATLVETINSREDSLREKFPNLTKEKQAAVLSQLSTLSGEHGERIFLSLFKEHISELGAISDSLQKISDTELINGAPAEGQVGDIQTSLALLTAILNIAKQEFETETPSSNPEDAGENN
tara:strand:+ start:1498 stop:2418 length:921 start_codon:yes stop_codon:yes gene_type:complete